MIIYKFGGATTRTKRGIDALVRRVEEASTAEYGKLHRRRRNKQRGLVIVISAIGHTTRHLTRAAEQAAAGHLALASDICHKLHEQHLTLLHSLNVASESDATELLDAQTTKLLTRLEGIHITRELSPRSRDAVLAAGEAFATAIVASALEDHGLPITNVQATELFITNEEFGHALPIQEEIDARITRRIRPLLDRTQIVLTQGFIGATRDGVTTTMGQESSDLSATLLAASLEADEITIWKNVPGIFTADPELIPDAKLIRTLSFDEAEELGARGARILFPALAQPIINRETNTILRIASPNASRGRSTTIQRTIPTTRVEKPIAIAVSANLAMLRLWPKHKQTNRNPHATTKIESLLAEATLTWASPTEAFTLIRAADHNQLIARLDANGWHHQLLHEQVAAIGIIIRMPDQKELPTATLGNIWKSMRKATPIHLCCIEHSIVVVVPQPLAVPTMATLHHALFRP